MGVKKYKICFSSFSSEQTLRFDLNYILQSARKYDFYRFKDLFDVIEFKKKEIPSEDFFYAEIGDVSNLGDINPTLLNFNDRTEDKEPLFKKIEKGDIIRPKKNDILLSKIRPYLKKNILITDNNNFYYTKAFIQIRPKNINSKIIYYLLQSKYFYKLNAISRCGKGYPTLNPQDFYSIKFEVRDINLIKKNEQQILAAIAPLEAEIASLKATKIPETDIINKVLGKELGLDWEKFEELKKIKQYKANLSDFSKNVDSRMSYKFHNLAEKYLWDFMISKSDKRLKNFISEPIVLGESVSPEQYAEEGEFYYIAMSNIKFWNFETDDCRTVKKSYSDKAIKKGKIVKKDDIILARSGEGTIGKVALITDDVNAIFADFTQRIRLNNFNPLCAYYYFRSDIFQYFIYSHKKGMGNNTNIFPNQVQEFPMPDWSLEKQSKIATLIKEQIDAQKIIDEQILKKQQQILQIVENAVR
ncbi:MAG: hypothetical protein IJZ71_03805 [Treponema sp.]|nr:hypothetical protein [Treponema sp.]